MSADPYAFEDRAALTEEVPGGPNFGRSRAVGWTPLETDDVPSECTADPTCRPGQGRHPTPDRAQARGPLLSPSGRWTIEEFGDQIREAFGIPSRTGFRRRASASLRHSTLSALRELESAGVGLRRRLRRRTRRLIPPLRRGVRKTWRKGYKRVRQTLKNDARDPPQDLQSHKRFSPPARARCTEVRDSAPDAEEPTMRIHGERRHQLFGMEGVCRSASGSAPPSTCSRSSEARSVDLTP
jgi:hypothetical protein